MEPGSDIEGLCRRCGRCCYAKVIIGDEVCYTDIPCEFLDPATKTCTVYGRRFEANPDCLTVEEGIKARVFPADFPYVAGLDGYRPPRTDSDPAEMARLYREET